MKMLISTFLILATLSAPFFSWATDFNAEDLKTRDDFFNFINENLLNRKISTIKQTSILGNGRNMESDWQKSTTVIGLHKTLRGLQMIVRWDITNIIFKIENGQRVEPGADRSGELIMEYNSVVRESTGKITGFLRIISSNLNIDISADSFSLVASLDDGKLTLRNSTNVYDNLFHSNGRNGYTPGGKDCTEVYEIIEGKVQNTRTCNSYFVDPVTLVKTPFKKENGEIEVPVTNIYFEN